MKYAAVGNFITNRLQFVYGRVVNDVMGGTAYGIEGLRLWHDDSSIICGAGTDMDKHYGTWFEKNNLSREGIRLLTDHTTYNYVQYRPDGTYYENSIVGTKVYGWNNFGYLTPTAADVERVCGGIVGLNICRGLDHFFWSEIGKLKNSHCFKVMWEIGTSCCVPENLERILDTLQYVDYFSINFPETKSLFGVETEEECLAKLKELDVEFTLFRVGEKGLYSIAGDQHWFVPCLRWDGDIVDPTGCGNSSTATALVALCEGEDPIMAGIMANITAHYNVRQYGPVFDMSHELRDEMTALAKKLRAEYPDQPAPLCQ